MINASPWLAGTGGIFLIALGVCIVFTASYYLRLKIKARKSQRKRRAKEERNLVEQADMLEARLAQIDIHDIIIN